MMHLSASATALLLLLCAASVPAQIELTRYTSATVPRPTTGTWPGADPIKIADSGLALWQQRSSAGHYRYFLTQPGHPVREITQQLPTGPTAKDATVWDMNNAGVMVGWFQEWDPVGQGWSFQTAFKFDATTSSLTTNRRSGYDSWIYYGISDAGHIAAQGRKTGVGMRDPGLWFWDPTGGTWTLTGTSLANPRVSMLGYTHSQGLGMSSSGATAGEVHAVRFPNPIPMAGIIMSAQGATVFSAPGSPSVHPAAINSGGDVLGHDVHTPAVLFRDGSSGTVTALPPEMTAQGGLHGTGAAVLGPNSTVHHMDHLWRQGQVIRLAALLENGITIGGFEGGINECSSNGTALVLRPQQGDALVLTPAGRCVGLQVDPWTPGDIVRPVPVSGNLTLTVVGIQKGQAAAVFWVLPGGALFPAALFAGTADANGRISASFPLPQSLQGQALNFKALALDSKVGLLDSPIRRITFQ